MTYAELKELVIRAADEITAIDAEVTIADANGNEYEIVSIYLNDDSEPIIRIEPI